MKRKNYSLHLTKGLGGKSIKCLCHCSSVDDINKKIYDWLHDPKSFEKYHIKTYQRTIVDEKNNERHIDFGDYSYFLTVKNPTE